SMSRLRNRHWRPTRTAGILPALIRRYTARRLTCRYSRTSSVVRNVSSITSASLLRGSHGRQLDGEDRTTVAVVRRHNLAPVFLGDPVRDRQAQTGSLAHFLGRIERLEETREGVGRNPAAGVPHARDHPLARGRHGGRQLDAAPLAGRRD